MRIAVRCAVLMMLVCAVPVQAGATASVVAAGGSATSVMVPPGGIFSVDIRLDMEDVAITAAQLQLVASADNVLSVTGGSYNGTDWDTNTNSLALPIDPVALGTTPATPIGSLPLNDSIGPGTTLLATVNLLVSSSAPDGTYTLNAANIFLGDLEFNDLIGAPGPPFSVVVSSGGAPPGGGGGTIPPDDGEITPPDDGGTEPPNGDGTTPPDDGGTGPPDDGGTNPPDDGGTAPADNEGRPPVVARCSAGMVESLAVSLTGLLLMAWPAPRRRRSRP